MGFHSHRIRGRGSLDAAEGKRAGPVERYADAEQEIKNGVPQPETGGNLA